MSKCRRRSDHYGWRMPHLFTSTERTKIDGVWTERESRCSWCWKAK